MHFIVLGRALPERAGSGILSSAEHDGVSPNHLDGYGKNIMLPSDFGDDQLLHDRGLEAGFSESNQPLFIAFRLPPVVLI
ncbi:hypothetical protein KIF59_24060 [Enterobacter cloacae subsp. cloacae]|nr:hypothetical protein [Enterobacter cloacae subsp. cloacae]